MKVNNKTASTLSQLNHDDAIQNKAGRLGNKKGVDSAAARTDSVTVALSDRAQDIKKVKDMVDVNQVDEAKVAYFQNLIDSGKYKVDAQAVADRLLDEHIKTDF